MDLPSRVEAVFDPQTPPDERWDRNKELFDEMRSSLRHPPVEELRDALDPLFVDDDFIAKATRLEPFKRTAIARNVPGRGSAILQINEYGVVVGQENAAESKYVERPGIGFDFLRYLFDSVDMLKAIVFTMTRFVVSHCEPYSRDRPEGFIWVRPDKEELTKEQIKESLRMTEWVMNCGDEADPRKRKRLLRPDMYGFTTKLMLDSLGADWCPTETPRDRRSKIAGLINMPYETIRNCTEEGYEGDDEVCAVQLLNNLPAVTFNYDDIITEIRNPRTDLTSNGYGVSEAECTLRVWTSYVNAVELNAAGLSKNSAPRGILTLFGDYDRREATATAKQFRAMLTGAANRFGVPIFVSKTKDGGAQWTKIDDFNEMYFSNFMSMLISVPCAMWGIDPADVNWPSFSAKSVSSLSGKDTGERFERSRDKGFRPALRFLERYYNTWVLPGLTGLRMRFVGANEEDIQAQQKRIELTATTNEMRKEAGLPPLTDKLVGEAPAGNGILMGVYLQANAPQEEGQPGQGEEQGSGEQDQGDEWNDEDQVEPEAEEKPEPKPKEKKVAKAVAGDDFLVVLGPEEFRQW